MVSKVCAGVLRKPRPWRMLSAVALSCSLLALPALAQSARDNQASPMTSAATAGSAPVTSAEDRSPGALARVRPAPRRYRKPGIDEQVKALSRTLNLDATQQSELKEALESQRRQVIGLMRDPSVRPEDRVGALRAINDNTVERIRGFLNEEQRKNYFRSGAPKTPGIGQGPSVDELLQRLNKQKQEASGQSQGIQR